ncbi:uncharacterized protein EI97DRAFT_462575 [Westerdykella ornata]|uniref:Endonuclease/exonuclease/phosphatase domain-containing protein n=1 Tax=Westerdykella ornata TaxID=318751 RepID=A0A6A6J5M0_WESOR|nr:uncharacterized protein EI97DRAFT_462575 [Westerdykella ornata]KAF2271692.1 hypothetical protein EI97DRAFT_462575 [Westerdykella ornata]
MNIRHISSLDHFTPAERRLFWEYADAKSLLPPKPISQKPPLPQSLQPQIYRSESSSWVALEKNQRGSCLQRGSILKVVSWNLQWSGPGPAERASVALEHLEQLFGTTPANLVIMLQKVSHQALQAILKIPWAQQNFVLTNVATPTSLYIDIPGDSFILKVPYWMAAPYFTLMMIPRYLGKCGIIAGLVGGDMNAIDAPEHELHKASEVELKDVWEDAPAPPIPVLKPFQKDFTYPRRMDKFFYTGLVETVALTEPQDLAGRLGRVGIGLQTEVEAGEDEMTESKFVRGKLVEKKHKVYYSDDQARRIFSGVGKRNLVHKRISTWVSDHFGIATESG